MSASKNPPAYKMSKLTPIVCNLACSEISIPFVGMQRILGIKPHPVRTAAGTNVRYPQTPDGAEFPSINPSVGVAELPWFLTNIQRAESACFVLPLVIEGEMGTRAGSK